MIVSVRHAQALDSAFTMKLSRDRCTNPPFPNLWLAAHPFVFKNPQTSLRYNVDSIFRKKPPQNFPGCKITIVFIKINEPHLWSVVDLFLYSQDTTLNSNSIFFNYVIIYVLVCLPKNGIFISCFFQFLIGTCVFVCFSTLIQEKDNKTCFCLFCTSFPFVFHSWLVHFYLQCYRSASFITTG